MRPGQLKKILKNQHKKYLRILRYSSDYCAREISKNVDKEVLQEYFKEKNAVIYFNPTILNGPKYEFYCCECNNRVIDTWSNRKLYEFCPRCGHINTGAVRVLCCPNAVGEPGDKGVEGI